MTSTQPTTRMSDDERTYLVLRVVIIAVGLGLYFLDYIPEPLRLERTLSLSALVLVSAGTLVVALASLTGRWRISRTMIWALPIDFGAISVYTWILAPQDAFFGVCVLLVVLYAITVSRLDAMLVALAISCAYIVGHAFGPAETNFGYSLIGLKAITLTLVGVIVANAVGRQRERERRVGDAVRNHEAVNEQLKRRVSELQAVAEITEIIHSSLDFDDVGMLVLDVISKVIDFPALAVFVIDKEKSETLFSASVGIPRDESMGVDGSIGLGEIETHLTCQRLFEHRSMMVLFCGSADRMERLTEDDRLVLYALASELAVAVENSRLYKLTMRLAVTDELTGMSNYRYLQQRLDEEVSRASRYGKHVSLLMLDTDDFKHFNDRHGHLAGDKALADFATLLAAAVREVDVAARYGGEEFAVVLPETDIAGAFVVAEKIREALADYLFEDADGIRCCTLTVSIGVATYPTYAYDKESLLREADDALYRAKNGGKNRVCAPLHSPEPETISGE